MSTLSFDILERLPDGAFLIAADGRIVYANRRGADLFGYEVHELVGANVDSLVPQRSRQKHTDHRAGFLKDPAVREMAASRTVYGTRKDGSLFEVDITLSPIATGDAQIVFTVVRDAAPRIRLAHELRLYEAAFEAAANGIVITDAEDVIQFANPAFCTLTGYDVEDLIGRSTKMLRSDEHDDAFYDDIHATLRLGRVWIGLVATRRSDGTHYIEERTVTPVRRADGAIGWFVTIGRDVTERVDDERFREDLVRQLRDAASTDPLTGVANRRRFFDLARRAVGRAQRRDENLSVIMFDLDHFKRINDTHGHMVGDEVLKETVRICSSTLRTDDIIARFGGEEFIILLPNTSLAAASVVAERMRETLEATAITTASGPVKVTLSAGVSTLGEQSPTIDRMIRCADDGLYDAKRAGRNRVSHSGGDDVERGHRRSVDADIRERS